MRELQNTYLTGNPEVDKYIIEDPNRILFGTVINRVQNGAYLIEWYRYLQQKLTDQEFQNYILHHYPGSYIDFLNQLTKDASYNCDFDTIMRKNACPFVETALGLTECFIVKELWLNEIIDYFCDPDNPFDLESTELILDTLIWKLKDEELLTKVYDYQETLLTTIVYDS